MSFLKSAKEATSAHGGVAWSFGIPGAMEHVKVVKKFEASS